MDGKRFDSLARRSAGGGQDETVPSSCGCWSSQPRRHGSSLAPGQKPRPRSPWKGASTVPPLEISAKAMTRTAARAVAKAR